tara:strand:+ start:323 stop:724 length:402 start_codon:yes stop_codon:yes gene_type:complete
MKRYNFCPGNMGSYDILFGQVPAYVQCPNTQQGETIAVSPEGWPFGQGRNSGGYLLVWLHRGGSGGGAFRFDGGAVSAGYLMEKMDIKLKGDANALLGFLRTQGLDVHIDDPAWDIDGNYRRMSAADYPSLCQ